MWTGALAPAIGSPSIAVVKKTLFPHTIGEEWPSPSMAVFQAMLVAGPQVDGSAVSSETPCPCGPRNCGQFLAETVADPRASTVNEASAACRSGLMGGPRLSSDGLSS